MIVLSVETGVPPSPSRVARAHLLPPRTYQWLVDWSWGPTKDLPRRPPDYVIEDTELFRPSHPVRLWRWSDHPETERHKFLRSFTHQQGMVEMMQVAAEQEGRGGEIIEEVVHPRYVLVDLTLVPQPQRDDFVDEVIVMREPRPR